MDTYENRIPEEESKEAVDASAANIDNTYEMPIQETKHGNRSPYEDSPYVNNYIPQNAPIEQPKKKIKRGKGWKRALCAILAIVLVVGSCAATAAMVNKYWETRMDNMEDAFEEKIEDLQRKINLPPVIPGGTVSAVTEGLTPSQVYAMNVQSVVMIYNKISTNAYGQTSTATSTGSGFVLSEDGYIVTNYHVVEGNGSISIAMWDGSQYKAALVGYDSANDVALLKVEASNLKAVTLGRSDDLIVGDQVVAIGNPLGELTSTLTVGYISAKERDVTTDSFAINMLQTDAAINSGNSGGPLFNMKGEVIGITTAKYSGNSSSGASIEGVGFAIPIDDVSGMLSDLATYGYVTGAYLGVSVSDMDASAASYYGMPMGAYVQEAVEGYAAAKAGVQVKDIIVALGEYEVENVNDLTRALRKFSAGETTTITVFRGGREMELSITLDEKPQNTSAGTETPETMPEEMPEGNFEEWFDFFKNYKDYFDKFNGSVTPSIPGDE